ncbi:MAG: OmpH family outer membrane protein [Pirellulales bacterium]|nr:OmpH family outer membrane protein [Pirellulales bacterium]
MRHQSIVAAAAVLTVLATGCGRLGGDEPTARLGGVAVIDLDLIAARLGSDRQMVDAISRRESALNQQLAEIARSYSQQITEKKMSLADEPPQDGVTLATFEQAAAESLEQVKRQAVQDLSAHKAQLVRQFRDQLRPAARQVARERGLSIIVTKNDAVVYDFAGGVDITEGVIAALQAGTPSTTPKTASTAQAQ